jgi:transcriptional regulator with XRE-family HTH domain
LKRVADSAEIQSKDEPDTDERESDRRLGSCVRSLRQRAELSIQELAQRTKLSMGMISQLERGLATPSVRTLRLLSLALEVPISYFFEQAPGAEPSPFIVRKSERKLLRLSSTGVLKELLSPQHPGQVEIYEITLQPGGSSGSGSGIQHKGEKAGYVLRGRLRLWLNNEPHILDAGDTFRFPGSVQSMFDNPADESASVLWISYASGQPPAGGNGRAEIVQGS